MEVPQKNPAIPLVAAILLLGAPLLYCGAYLALVTPAGRFVTDPAGDKIISTSRNGVQYTFLGRAEYYPFAASTFQRVFWPLEQLDRRIRPQSWRRYPYPEELRRLDVKG